MDYFTKTLNYKAPKFCNPFDFILTILQNKDIETKKLHLSYKENLEEEFINENNEHNLLYSSKPLSNLEDNKKQISWCYEFSLLFKRTLIDFFRNKYVFYAKIFQFFMCSLIFAGFYSNIGHKENLFYNLLGYSFNITNNLFINGLFNALFMIPVIRKVLKREYSSKLYSISAFYAQFCLFLLVPSLIAATIYVPICYFTIRVESDFKTFILHYLLNLFQFSLGEFFGNMTGSFVGDQLGLIVSPLFFVLFLLGSGFFRSNQSFPVGLRWLNYISPYRYIMELYIYIQKDYNEITEMIGEKMGYDIGVENCMIILGSFMIFTLITGFIAVRNYASKF